MIKIIKGTKENLDLVVPLFDQYRIFYKQESDKKAARAFLEQRINNDESIIFLAFFDNIPVGFTQLYPMFSSVSMQPSYVLNDLFVDASYRQKQVGEALLNHAKLFCKENNGKGLTLETATDNPARKLYEKLGWKKDLDCFHYFWTVN